MIEYRQKLSTQVWHWRRDCSQWPTVNCCTLLRRPDSGKMCEECGRKQAAADAALKCRVQGTPRPPENTTAEDDCKTSTRSRRARAVGSD
jgi:hypothetical protein